MTRQERLKALRERVNGQVPALAKQIGVTPRVLRFALDNDNPPVVRAVAEAVIQQDATRNRQSKTIFTPLL